MTETIDIGEGQVVISKNVSGYKIKMVERTRIFAASAPGIACQTKPESYEKLTVCLVGGHEFESRDKEGINRFVEAFAPSEPQVF